MSLYERDEENVVLIERKYVLPLFTGFVMLRSSSPLIASLLSQSANTADS